MALRAADLRIAELSSRSHGIITARQLRVLGVSRDAVATRVARGTLHVVYPRIYAVGRSRLTQRATWVAAGLAAGEHGALSHCAAGAFLSIWRRRVATIDVTGCSGSQALRRDTRFHERHLAPHERMFVEGTYVTTIPVTLVDLCRYLKVEQVAAAISQAEFLNLLDPVELRAVMASTRRGRQKLEAALTLVGYGSVGTRSWLEDRFALLMTRAGMAVPPANIGARVRDGIIEVDRLIRELRLCLEVDGPAHERPAQIMLDAQRDARLMAAGYRVERFSWRDVQQRPEDVVGRLRILVELQRGEQLLAQ